MSGGALGAVLGLLLGGLLARMLLARRPLEAGNPNLATDELPLAEVSAGSRQVKLKGFSLNGQGKLAATNQRLVFMDRKGRELIWELPFSRVREVSTQPARGMSWPTLSVRYSDENGADQETTFRIPHDQTKSRDVLVEQIERARGGRRDAGLQ